MTTPLNSQQLHTLRGALDTRMKELRTEILEELARSDSERYSTLAEQTHDLEDQSLADLLVDINLADLDRHINETRDIEAALIRLADGTYGRCTDCGEPIGFERLQVYPTAKRCIGCQTDYEKRRDERHPTI